MCEGKRLLLLILFLACGISVSGQNKTKGELQKEKQRSVERIREVEKILNETTAKKKNTLGELSALNQRIIEQQKLISSIRNEINLLNGEIRENNGIIQVLEGLEGGEKVIAAPGMVTEGMAVRIEAAAAAKEGA